MHYCSHEQCFEVLPKVPNCQDDGGCQLTQRARSAVVQQAANRQFVTTVTGGLLGFGKIMASTSLTFMKSSGFQPADLISERVVLQVEHWALTAPF